MNERLRAVLELLKETVLSWYDDNAFILSGALAYFTVFSLAPLLIVVLFMTGLFWDEGSTRVQERILTEVTDLAGAGGAAMVRTMLESAQRPGSGDLVATAVGVAALVIGATGVFVQLKLALNTVWHVAPQGIGVKVFLLTRLLSFGMVVSVGLLLLVSLLVSAAIAAAGELVENIAPPLVVLVRVLHFVVSFSVVAVLLAMIFRYLPDVDIPWQDVWLGAGLTAVLFSAGEYVIGLYLGNAAVTSSYGAAGSFAVLLLWVYYSSLIVFFGAEFTKVYAKHHGSRAAHKGGSAPLPVEE